MKKVFKFSTLILLFILSGCFYGERVKETKVELSDIRDNTIIIFDMDSIRVFLGKSDLMKYCEKNRRVNFNQKENYSLITTKGDTVFTRKADRPDAPDTIIFRGDTFDIVNIKFQSYFNKLKYPILSSTLSVDTVFDEPTLLRFLQELNDTTVIIRDSIVTKLDSADSYPSLYSIVNGDSVNEDVDFDSKQTQYSRILESATFDLLKEGKGKVFDVKENKFVEYIIIKDLTDWEHGDVEMYLPNGKIFYRVGLWIV